MSGVDPRLCSVSDYCLLRCCSLPETLNVEITKKCNVIFPLQNVHIRKVKTLKSPKFDRKSDNLASLMCLQVQ